MKKICEKIKVEVESSNYLVRYLLLVTKTFRNIERKISLSNLLLCRYVGTYWNCQWILIQSYYDTGILKKTKLAVCDVLTKNAFPKGAISNCDYYIDFYFCKVFAKLTRYITYSFILFNISFLLNVYCSMTNKIFELCKSLPTFYYWKLSKYALYGNASLAVLLQFIFAYCNHTNFLVGMYSRSEKKYGRQIFFRHQVFISSLPLPTL